MHQLASLESTKNTKQVPPTTHFRIVRQNKQRKMVYNGQLKKRIQPNTHCNWPRIQDCLAYKEKTIQVYCYALWIVKCPYNLPRNDGHCIQRHVRMHWVAR